MFSCVVSFSQRMYFVFVLVFIVVVLRFDFVFDVQLFAFRCSCFGMSTVVAVIAVAVVCYCCVVSKVFYCFMYCQFPIDLLSLIYLLMFLPLVCSDVQFTISDFRVLPMSSFRCLISIARYPIIHLRI